jgi:septum formation topological specificity factor MinE
MSAEEQSAFGDPELSEMNRILQKVLAKERPTAEELEFLRQLRLDVVDLFHHSRRVDRR